MTEEEQVIEQVTEQKMYDTMAEYMKEEKGMDVTATEISDMIEEQTSENPPEPTEKDDEIIEAMVEMQDSAPGQNPQYLVRGALLKCKYGTHCRKLNLPNSHGVNILGKGAMNQGDCIPMVNISPFGLCQSPMVPPNAKIILKTEAPRNADGSFTGAPGVGIVEGVPCIPLIIGNWQEAHSNTKVGKAKQAAITTNSFLVCSLLGVIEPWRSGQED